MNAPENHSCLERVAVSPSDVLGMMPPGLQFRFLDEILEVNQTHIVARHQFRTDEFFYPGHFPERAITPGTILLEAMCQCGVTAHSYYLLAQEMPIELARNYRVLFTGAEVEWFEPVVPGATIILRSRLIGWRRRRIRSHVRLFDGLSRIAAECRISGMSVLLSAEGPVIRSGAQDGQFEPAIEPAIYKLGRNES